ncbi:Hybrid signal transduction histidine kinase A [Hondaea fermentalgiana]|uniref:histidine kinase n=1 Tax=Hondaea fermentalgiana TaxID=2315210 RepID=A0A2R5G800_9STRA|nr:Hybrid signal transduction histidine kinase A [Hondaea fermentalgiana]|eukprot:GBG27186.1 Hybrid signal transduction histidine kinase A [Hondaea fermentalgiana]
MAAVPVALMRLDAAPGAGLAGLRVRAANACAKKLLGSCVVDSALVEIVELDAAARKEVAAWLECERHAPSSAGEHRQQQGAAGDEAEDEDYGGVDSPSTDAAGLEERKDISDEEQAAEGSITAAKSRESLPASVNPGPSSEFCLDSEEYREINLAGFVDAARRQQQQQDKQGDHLQNQHHHQHPPRLQKDFQGAVNIRISRDSPSEFTAALMEVPDETPSRPSSPSATSSAVRSEAVERLLSSMPNPVITATNDMVITYANPCAEEVFGYDTGELVGQKVNVLMGKSDREQHDKYVDRYQTTGQARIIGRDPRPIVGTRKDGSELRLLLTVNRHATFDGYCAVFVDATREFLLESHTQRILTSVATPVVRVNKLMKITFVNNNALETFGYKHDELLGKSVNILMTTRDRDSHDSYVDRYRRTGKGRIIGQKPRLVNGQTREGLPLKLYLTVTQDAVGDGFCAVFTNVTREVELAERTSRILSSMASPVVRADKSMCITYVNPNAEDVFGYEAGELLGQNVMVLMLPKDADNHDNIIARFHRTGVSRVINRSPRLVDGKRKDGSTLRLYITITCDGDDGYTACFTDVTEAFEQRERVERLASMDAPVLVLDHHLNIDYVNRSANSIFCSSSDTIVGANIRSFLCPSNPRGIDGAIEDLLQTAKQSDSDDVEKECSGRAGSVTSGSQFSSAHLFSKFGRRNSSRSTGTPHDDSTGSDVGHTGDQILRMINEEGNNLLMQYRITQNKQGYTLALFDVTKEVAMSNQLSAIIRNVSSGVVVVDKDLHIRFVNHHGLATLGYRARDVINRPLSMFGPDFKDLTCFGVRNLLTISETASEDGDEVIAGSKSGTISPNPQRQTFRALTKHGNSVFVHVECTMALEYYTLVLTDVTEEHTLMIKVNSMLDATPSLLFMFGADPSFQSGVLEMAKVNSRTPIAELPLGMVSKSCRRLFQQIPSASGHSKLQALLNIVASEDRAKVEQCLAKTFGEEPDSTNTMEARIKQVRKGEHSVAWYGFSITKLRSGQCFVSAQDIGAEVQLREELRSKLVQGSSSLAQAMADSSHIRRVLQYVAHEYRNFFFGAATLVEDLCDELQGSAMHDDMQQILRIHNRMGQLFDDCLLMQKIEAQEYTYVRSSLKLKTVLDDAVAYAQNRDRKRTQEDVNFRPILGEKAIDSYIVGSAAHLYQAITNLVSNAFKYNSAGGIVVLEAQIEGPDAVIQVRDTGIGIPEAKRAVIFEPYKRLATGSHRVGTGLGLSFAKDFVVKGCGGSIKVKSNNVEGQGTVFEIRIPTVPAPTKAPSTPPVSPQATMDETTNDVAEGAKDSVSTPTVDDIDLPRDVDVIVVDDDDIIRLTLSRRLRKLKWPLEKLGRRLRVMEGAFGEDVVRMALEQNMTFSLITIDQDMGADHYSGSETIRVLRDAGYHGSIVGLTGNESDDERRQMLVAGAQHVLIKGSKVFSEIDRILQKCLLGEDGL